MIDPEPKVGDTVRIGKGKVLWTVLSFWTAPSTGVRYANLHGGGGYSGTSVTLDRLTIVEVPELVCRGCGCTDSHACPGGCYWFDRDLRSTRGGPLCSRCADGLNRRRLDEDSGVLGVGQDGDHATLG